MLKQVLKKISSALFGHQGTIQTFTYYVPAPPPRKSGYREKEFDKLFHQFINQGFEVLEQKVVPHTSEGQCGMWVIFLVRSLRPENDAMNFNFPSIKEDQTESLAHSESETDAESVAFPKDIYYE